jgi:hypothetical protein
MPNENWPDWEKVLAAAAHLQMIIPIQLANPMPYDLDQTNLAEYKNLSPDIIMFIK